jgi:hypothetical protein
LFLATLHYDRLTNPDEVNFWLLKG